VGSKDRNSSVYNDELYSQELAHPVFDTLSNFVPLLYGRTPELVTTYQPTVDSRDLSMVSFSENGVSSSLAGIQLRQQKLSIGDVIAVQKFPKRTLVLANYGIMEVDPDGDTLRPISDRRMGYIRNAASMWTSGDTIIVISYRRFWTSTDQGDTWRVVVAPNLFVGASQNVRAGNTLFTIAAGMLSQVHIDSLFQRDTVAVQSTLLQGTDIKQIAGTIGDAAIIVTGIPSTSLHETFRYDTLRVHTIDGTTQQHDSVSVVPSKPIIGFCDALVLHDTLRIVNVSSGRHIDIVDGSVSRDVTYTNAPLFASSPLDVYVLPDSSGYVVVSRAPYTGIAIFPLSIRGVQR